MVYTFAVLPIASKSAGADPGWLVRGGVEAKIGTKRANFARFWLILEGRCPHNPFLDPPLVCIFLKWYLLPLFVDMSQF